MQNDWQQGGPIESGNCRMALTASNRLWRGRGVGSGLQPRGSLLVRCGGVRTARRLAAGGTGRRLWGLAEVRGARGGAQGPRSGARLRGAHSRRSISAQREKELVGPHPLRPQGAAAQAILSPQGLSAIHTQQAFVGCLLYTLGLVFTVGRSVFGFLKVYLIISFIFNILKYLINRS